MTKLHKTVLEGNDICTRLLADLTPTLPRRGRSHTTYVVSGTIYCYTNNDHHNGGQVRDGQAARSSIS